MNYLELQVVFASQGQPEQAQLQHWLDTALAGIGRDTEVVVRIVDEAESAELNHDYRGKQGSTNILSFPFEAPDIPGFESELLGDLVVCAPVLAKEAIEQGKPLSNHWAHIIIHGVLHLLGYDHIDEAEAEAMESQEIAILAKLQIPNPYITG
jgi:probable rRNA maturation factor